MKYAFFGSSKASIYVLDELMNAGFKPDLIVTTPDKPQGRAMKLTPNVVKVWAQENHIKCTDPAILDADFESTLRSYECDLFIVASYGKIMPASIVFMPKYKTLNVHPSLLPDLRGASPLQSTILQDKKSTGVTIMRMDEKMDHGPLVAVKHVNISEWPIYEEFEELMLREGGKLLSSIIPEYISGKITEHEQDHSKATFTKKIIKEQAEITLSDDPYANFRKIQAYHESPIAFFTINKNGRNFKVKITSASYENGDLVIHTVIPEGSKEMSFKDFESGYGKLS